MSRSLIPFNLFLYRDYRSFLKDWYAHAKKNRRGFSFRAFSQKAGFGSPNFLKRVMEGERNLTEESAVKCAVALELNKQETEFFKNLVFYNQAETHEEQDFYYRNLVRSRKLGELKPMEKDQYDYYSTWYHPVVRELVTSPDFDGTPEWIASKVYPPITSSQVIRSLDLLEKLGFLEKKGKGWVQSNPLVTTGAEATALVMRNYHQEWLGLARELLPQIPASERDVSVLTLGISRGRLPQIKKKVQEMRQEILKMVSEDTRAEEVVVLSIQLLPVTKKEDMKGA